MKNKIKKYGFEVKNREVPENKERKSSLDIIEQKQYELTQSMDFLAYSDFFTYKSLFDVLESSYKINDYIFRALLLLFLETNNGVTISQEVKLKFIVKVQKYEDLKSKDFSPFLQISYINKETKAQLIKLVNIFVKNVDNMTHITYDIFLFLLIRICENREKNKCVFNHLVKSKKIFSIIFFKALNYNKEAYNLIFSKFLTLSNLILPFHKKPFLSEFLFDALTTKAKEIRTYGQILLNLILLINFQDKREDKDVRDTQQKQDVKDVECFYHIKLNSVILLYRVIKTSDFFKFTNDLNLSDQGLHELFNDNLVTTKVNIFKDIPFIDKKKCYAEVLYEIMMFLCIYSRKESYYCLICQMFVMFIQHFKKTNNDSKTIVYYLDEIKGQGDKTNKALKIFNKPEAIDVPCLSLQFLTKTLKYQFRCQDQTTRNLLNTLASSFYNDTFLMFSKHSSKKKKYKNKVIYNFLYEIVKQDVSKKKQKTIEEVIALFSAKYQDYLKEKRKKLGLLDDKRNCSVMNAQIKDFFKIDEETEDLNDSFSSCKSSKDTKAVCSLNQKKICKTINKRKNFVKKIYKKIDKEDPFDLDDEEENIYNSNNQEELPMGELQFTKTIITSNTNKKESSHRILFNINLEHNPFSLEKIETMNKVLLFPKSTLMEQIFGIYFIDRLFYNKTFIKMKNYFKYYIKNTHDIEIPNNNFFNYPIIMKNYISNNLYFGGLFLKHDLDFFINRYFNISHSYFKEKLKNIQ